MKSSVPRLSGVALRFVSRLMAAERAGAPLRRLLGAMVVEQKLAAIDFAAEGEPAPLYMPRGYDRGGRR